MFQADISFVLAGLTSLGKKLQKIFFNYLVITKSQTYSRRMHPGGFLCIIVQDLAVRISCVLKPPEHR